MRASPESSILARLGAEARSYLESESQCLGRALDVPGSWHRARKFFSMSSSLVPWGLVASRLILRVAVDEATTGGVGEISASLPFGGVARRLSANTSVMRTCRGASGMRCLPVGRALCRLVEHFVGRIDYNSFIQLSPWLCEGSFAVSRDCEQAILFISYSISCRRTIIS